MIANPLKIQYLVHELESGGIRIPEIQRKYVWSRPQVAKFFDSIYREFPVGSLLLWDTPDADNLRELDANLGAGVKADFAPKIVLDGQQRITSLGRIFNRQAAKQERICFNIISEIFEPYSNRIASDPKWVDLTELLTGQLHEADVVDALMDAGIIARDDKLMRNNIYDRLKKVTSIREFQMPVEIVRGTDLETVMEIFIRVNSAGTRLRQAELALARLAWKLPGSIIGPLSEMEDVCEERGFDLDSRFFMRALISVATRQSRFADLKTFWQRPSIEIDKLWKNTEMGISLALDFVEGNIGIPGSVLLPSHISLIPIIVVFAQRESLSHAEEKNLQRWFLLANAFSRYVGATETTLNQDLATLGQKCENIEELYQLLIKDSRGNITITADDLERAGINSPFFPLAYLAVIKRDASDWFKGVKIRRESFTEDQNIEYHHIFPRKLLNDLGIERYLRDEMANMAFLSAKANRKIRATEPAKYLPSIAKDAPERLEAQFVPLDSTLWELDRFEDFLKIRRMSLASAMNEILEN